MWYPPDSAALVERLEGRVAWRGVSAGFSRIRAALTGRTAEVESRAVTSVPWTVGAQSVSSVTQERALRLIPVYAAVRLIADTVATLPLKAFRKVGDEREPMSSLPQLFKQLDDDGELTPWLHRCMTSLLLRGNAYGLVTARDGMQFPTVVQWLSPDEVHCDDRNPWAPVWYWNGRTVPTEDLVHIPWFTVPGRAQGLSPIEAYASTVNVGLQAQSYASGWFDNGGVPPGTFKNTSKTVTPTESDEIRDRLVRAIRSGKPIVYGSDWDYNAITISPEQAQFVETARLTATQIAAIYGVPPEMIGGETGGSLTYATVEQNQLQLATLTLRPWLVTLERKFSSVLPMRQQIKFNADAIVRADLMTRMNAYKVAKEIGLRNVDELRGLEDLPPLPDGQGKKFTPVQPQQPAFPRLRGNTDPRQAVLELQARRNGPADLPPVERRRSVKRDPDGQFSDGIWDVGMPDEVASYEVPATSGTLKVRSNRRTRGDDVEVTDGTGTVRLSKREQRDIDNAIRAGRPSQGVRYEEHPDGVFGVVRWRLEPRGQAETEDGEPAPAGFVLHVGETANPDVDYDRPGVQLSAGQADAFTYLLDKASTAQRVDSGYGPLDVFATVDDRLALRMKGDDGTPVEVAFGERDWEKLGAAMNYVIDGVDDSNPDENAPSIDKLTVKTAAGDVTVTWRGPRSPGGEYPPDSVMTITPDYPAAWSVAVDGGHMAATFDALAWAAASAGFDETGYVGVDELSRSMRGKNSLKEYWLTGAGRAKWQSWTDLYEHLKKHMPDGKAKRIAAEWFHERYGYWPGHQKGDNPHGPG